MILEKWGITRRETEIIENEKNNGIIPGRIISESRNIFDVVTERGIVRASLSGKLSAGMSAANDIIISAVAGDWVWLRTDSGVKSSTENSVDVSCTVFPVDAVFPRRSHIARKVPGGRTRQQILASNIDIVFIVMALDGGRNFNLRALERYAALAWNSGAVPVVVLNKAEMCEDPEAFRLEAEVVSPGIKVIPASAKTGLGVEEILKYMGDGITAVFIGPSGVGKSTLTNIITGTISQETGGIRENDKRGRHTTSGRAMLQVRSGGVVIDTPGLREIQLWIDENSLDLVFSEISEIASGCRFSDCSHTGEPGCAVIEALEHGVLDISRYESYLRLKKEVEYTESRKDQLAMLEKKEKWKKISRYSKEIQKERRMGR